MSKDELKMPALRTLEISFLFGSQGLVPISPFQLWLHSTLFHFFNKFPKQLSTLKSLHGFTVQLTGCVLVSFLLCSLMSHTKSDNLNVPISLVVCMGLYLSEEELLSLTSPITYFSWARLVDISSLPLTNLTAVN